MGGGDFLKKGADFLGDLGEKTLKAPAGVVKAGIGAAEAAFKGDLKGMAQNITNGVNSMGPLMPGGMFTLAGVNTVNSLIQGEDPIKAIFAGATMAFPQYAPLTGLAQQALSGKVDPSALFSAATKMNILPPGVDALMEKAAPVFSELATSKDPASALLRTFGGPAADAAIRLLPEELRGFATQAGAIFQNGGNAADLLGPATSMVGSALRGDLGQTIFQLANGLQEAGLVSPDKAIESAVNILLGSTVQGLGQLSLPGGFAGGPNLLDHTN